MRPSAGSVLRRAAATHFHFLTGQSLPRKGKRLPGADCASPCWLFCVVDGARTLVLHYYPFGVGDGLRSYETVPLGRG